MHARYYNPNIARFLSVDPGRDVDPKVPQKWNLYAYVSNNPTSGFDPNGREEKSYKVLTLNVNLIYANADVTTSYRAQTLRQVTEAGLSYSRNFFSQAGITLAVRRFEGSANVSSLANVTGSVRTPSGDVSLVNFTKSQGPATVTVLASGDLGFAGKTVGVGGPTALGVMGTPTTFNDELAHALGNVLPINIPGVSNAIADTLLDIQEINIDVGLALDDEWERLFRETLKEIK